MKNVLQSSSSEETMKMGYDFAKILLKKSKALAKGAVVVALSGDLGAGKTTFVQGFLKGLGFKKRSPSPTFIIFRRHRLKRNPKLNPRFSNLYHMDAYRLKDHKAIDVLNFKEVLDDPANIVLIEWAEKIKEALPKDAIKLKFSHGKKEDQRKISFS